MKILCLPPVIYSLFLLTYAFRPFKKSLPHKYGTTLGCSGSVGVVRIAQTVMKFSYIHRIFKKQVYRMGIQSYLDT